MPRRKSGYKPGDLMAFRVPENINPADLEHLNSIVARKKAPGSKLAPLNEFLFDKVFEDRMASSTDAAIYITGLTKDQVEQLNTPIVQKAIGLYVQQLVGSEISNMERVVSKEDVLVHTPEEPTEKNANVEEKNNVNVNKEEVHHDAPDPAISTLLRHLRS